MDPSAVAAFYQAKGYTVTEGVRVPGLSGNEHRVPLLAEGPLGSLAIFFGDFGGVDGPEMGGARKAARDIGATPVLAADGFSNNDRQVAARLGVVLLDGSMMAEDGPADEAPPQASWPGLQVRPAAKPAEPEPHPWPVSGRVGGRDGPGLQPIDIDDLLAPRRSAVPAASAQAHAPASADAVLAAMAAETEAPSAGTAAAQGAGASADAESLWRRPRAAPLGAVPPPGARSRSGARFGWLEGAPATRSARGGKPADKPPTGGDGFAVDYDDVVPARSPGGDGEPAGGVAEGTVRLGDDADLQPTMDQLERKARRDKLARRVFWALFLFVFVYLFYLFWTNQLGN